MLLGFVSWTVCAIAFEIYWPMLLAAASVIVPLFAKPLPPLPKIGEYEDDQADSSD